MADKILAAKATADAAALPQGEQITYKDQSEMIQRLAADTNKAGGHVERSETSIWEKQIDTLVYALYNLTEEEIKIVEGV